MKEKIFGIFLLAVLFIATSGLVVDWPEQPDPINMVTETRTYPAGTIVSVSYYNSDWSEGAQRTIINTETFSIVICGIHTLPIGARLEFVETVDADGNQTTQLRIIGEDTLWEVVK
ncbi:MAG: hypothetical protein WC734_06295 [Patescibacteria group bacterium]|jgi:hypothetical protein